MSGLQISLFDTGDPAHLKRLATQLFGGAGSNPLAAVDHHAFFFDAESQLMAIPVLQAAANSSGNLLQQARLAFTGAIVYRLKDTFTEVKRISHSDLVPTTCLQSSGASTDWQSSGRWPDIERTFKQDGQLITMSRYGIKSHSYAHLEAEPSVTPFPAQAGFCP